MKAPCKGCQEREPGCHGKCDKYQAFRAEQDRILEARHEIVRSTPGKSRALLQYLMRKEDRKRRG